MRQDGLGNSIAVTNWMMQRFQTLANLERQTFSSDTMLTSILQISQRVCSAARRHAAFPVNNAACRGEIRGNKEVQLLLDAHHIPGCLVFCFWQKKETKKTFISSFFQNQPLHSARTFSPSLALPRISCHHPFTRASTLTGERETASCQTVNISLSIRLFTVKKKERTAAKRHKLSSQNVQVVRRLPACAAVVVVAGEWGGGTIQLR